MEERSTKILKAIVAFLLAIATTIIAFTGWYTYKNGIWEDKLSKVNLGMDLEGARHLRFILDETVTNGVEVYVDEEGNYKGNVISNTTTDNTVSIDALTEESKEEIPYKTEKRDIKANDESAITRENFELTKKIIQKRINKENNFEYNIRVDDLNKTIEIEVPNDDDLVSEIQSDVVGKGEIVVTDTDTGVILMDNSDIKSAKATIGTSQSDTSKVQFYLSLTLNKEGKEKFHDMSIKYKTHEHSEDEEHEEEAQKSISVAVDGQVVCQTTFADEMNGDIFNVFFGSPVDQTDQETYLAFVNYSAKVANAINSGVLPLQLVQESDTFIVSNTKTPSILATVAICALMVVVSFVYFLIKYKSRGLVAFIVGVGYISTTVVLIRLIESDVVVTFNSLLAGLALVAINFMFIKKLYKNSENSNSAFFNTLVNTYIIIIPLIVIAVVFTLYNNILLSSVGKILFWGILIHALYSIIITRTMYITKK
ncbi:MAG: hypothetical protein IKN74_00195 [Clostridia bacterium]|nr:hypothetical protein [Clostridia bacterium]